MRAVVLAAAALLLLVRLGATGFWAPDEPRYGAVAEEMRSMPNGWSDLVLLRLDGEPYTQKPPLYYWLAAAAGAPLGRVTEAAARLPSAVAGIALVAATLAFGSRLLGGASGTLGAALLLTTWTFADAARRVQLDVVLALFELLALAAFWRFDRGIGGRRANLAALHASLGLAVLTKGPVGFLVPLLAIAAFLAWDGRLRRLGGALPAWGFALSLGPAAAWLGAAVALAPSGFFGEAVTQNLFGRFFAGTSHPRPAYYYLYQFPIELLPWTLAAPVVLWAGRRRIFRAEADEEERRAWRFLLAWVAATLVFFSLSSGKRGLYVLPALPAAALLTGDALRRWIEARRRIPVAFHVACGTLGAAVVAGGIWMTIRNPLHDLFAARATGAAAIAVVVAALGASLATSRMRAPLRLRIGVPIAALFAVELVLFAVAFPARDPEKSPRALAEAAAALTPPDAAIGLVGDRALVGGLAYYGRRRVAFLGDRAQIARFVADGGAAIVVAERKQGRVEAVTPVTVRHRSREGRRALLVVTPRVAPE
jgi:4-amino-4-deoxy-L-arabinose transferase-like glycosyltransferase